MNNKCLFVRKLETVQFNCSCCDKGLGRNCWLSSSVSKPSQTRTYRNEVNRSTVKKKNGKYLLTEPTSFLLSTVKPT